jgi:hypothetical protein
MNPAQILTQHALQTEYFGQEALMSVKHEKININIGSAKDKHKY